MHIAIDVARRYVDEDKADELSILAADAGRACLVIDVRQKFDGHLRTAGRWNEDALDRAKILPEVASVSCVNGIPLAAFNRGCDGLAADGGFNDVVHVLNREAIARRRFSIDGEIKEIAARRALGEDRA